jgi:hypothetical protein
MFVCRYGGAISTVSARELIILYAIFGSLAQSRIRPRQRALAGVVWFQNCMNRISQLNELAQEPVSTSVQCRKVYEPKTIHAAQPMNKRPLRRLTNLFAGVTFSRRTRALRPATHNRASHLSWPTVMGFVAPTLGFFQKYIGKVAHADKRQLQARGPTPVTTVDFLVTSCLIIPIVANPPGGWLGPLLWPTVAVL